MIPGRSRFDVSRRGDVVDVDIDAVNIVGVAIGVGIVDVDVDPVCVENDGGKRRIPTSSQQVVLQPSLEIQSNIVIYSTLDLIYSQDPPTTPNLIHSTTNFIHTASISSNQPPILSTQPPISST